MVTRRKVTTIIVSIEARSFFRCNPEEANGKSRSTADASAGAPGRVSVKTAVIGYVPAGVELEVVIVSAPEFAE